MTIASLPAFFDMYYTEKNGKLTPDGYLYNDQTFQALNLVVILINSFVNSAIINGTIINNGIVPPAFTTAEITAFGADATIPNGTIWFNTDTSEWQGKSAASTIKTFTVT